MFPAPETTGGGGVDEPVPAGVVTETDVEATEETAGEEASNAMTVYEYVVLAAVVLSVNEVAVPAVVPTPVPFRSTL